MSFFFKLKSSAHDTLQYLFTHKKVLIIILFLLTVLIRAPNLLRDYTSNDSAVIYMDVASNIKDGNGWRVDHRFTYTDDTFEDDSIAHQMHEAAPLYPLFLAGVFIFNESFTAAIFANILLAGLLVVLVYLFADKLFGQKIALVSAVVVMLNPTMYALSVCVWSEILFCILLLSSFYFAIFSKNNYHFVLSGIFAGMAYLTRYPGVVIVAAILIWLLFIRKKYKPAFIFGVFSFLVALPWFIRNYLLFNNPLFYSSGRYKYLSGMRQNYPSLPSSLQYPFIEFLRYSCVTFLHNLSALCSPESLFILVPFVIIGCLLYMKKRSIQPLIIFSFLLLIVTSIGQSLSGWYCRYLIPIFIVLTPLGVATMFESIKHLMNYVKSDVVKTLRDYRKIITILLLLLLFIYSFQIVGETYYNYNVKTMHLSEQRDAYKWLSDHTSNNDKTASTYPCDDHYFTGLESILIPDVNETVMEGFIERFCITYFVIILNPGFDAYLTNITRELYFGNENVTVGSKNLNMVYRNDAVLIYKVC